MRRDAKGPFYIYTLYKPKAKKPFYVGATSNPVQRLKDHTNRFRRIWGISPTMKIIGKVKTKNRALVEESRMIALINKANDNCLINKVKKVVSLKSRNSPYGYTPRVKWVELSNKDTDVIFSGVPKQAFHKIANACNCTTENIRSIIKTRRRKIKMEIYRAIVSFSKKPPSYRHKTGGIAR